MTLTVGSLFSGIGGLDLGLERAGMQVIWQSEIDPYACKVLKKHWPEVPNHGDIKQIDWRAVEPVDVICGGYPCQPFSTAGKRQGTDDPRHLWPWVRTAISELRPRYAILENVRGHLSLGGTQVIGELAEIGYDAEWRVVSAAGVGAPHRRDRIIIVAYPNGRRSEISTQRQQPSKQLSSCDGKDGKVRDVANTNGRRQQKRNKDERSIPIVDQEGDGKSMANTNSEQLGKYGVTEHVGSQNQIWGYNGRRETSYDGWQWWETEPDVGRVADGIPNRVDRLRGLGNAVVPQVAEYIGRLITTSLDA